MNLRLRLIVVFFLLSVVPVGAVTYFTYASNAQAIRDAAGAEAEQLAGELSERMRTVTAQLSQRVESLMALPAPAAPPKAPASDTKTATTVPPQVAEPAAPAPPLPAPSESELLAETLGDFADMINNIEIRGGRGFGGRRGGPPPDGRGLNPGRGPSLDPAAGSRAGGTPPPPDGGADGQRGAAATGQPASTDGRRGGGPGADGRLAAPPDGRGGAFGGGRSDAPPDPNRIRIDLGQVRRDLFDELVPDREAFGALPPEQRQAILDQIDQRMLGVNQGIQVLQKELASRAALAAIDVRTQPATPTTTQAAGTGTRGTRGAAAGAPATTSPASPPDPSGPSVPAPPAAPLPTPPASAAPVPTPPASEATVATPTASAATSRSTELSGRRLAVRVRRGGEVVGQVDADVDLNKLLATVFESTSRDRREVPFAVGEDGTLYTPTDEDKTKLRALRTTALRADSAPGTTVMPGWIVATTPDPTGSGLKFGIARPFGDALSELLRSSARSAGLGLGVIALALLVIVPLSGRLTRNLDTLSAGVHRIAQGDYAARVPARSNDEIGRLAVAFNRMAADVEAHQRSAVAQERIRRELELGRQIQHDMLPQVPLRLGLTEVKGVSVPAREVGGDFFNYFQLPDGTIALLVGDVSGKGVGAALLMANIQAALRTRLSLGQDLASLAQELDVDIERSTPGPVYATLFIGILDPVSRRLRCVNAGHNPQYILRPEGRLERMESTGRPIGLYSGGGYAQQDVALAVGDVLFFYTDGCVDAENAVGEMFGSERLERVLAASAGLGADQVIVAVESEVSRFRAGVELQDDATMMVVKVG